MEYKYPMKKIVIFGAASAIAQETAKLFAADGDKIFLVGRDENALKIMEQDLKVWGASDVSIAVADLNDFEKHPTLLEKAKQFLGTIDLVLIAHGALGNQKIYETDYTKAELELKTNFLSVVSLLIPLSHYFQQQKAGTIAVITSVAGDRGRQRNCIYGAAKGATSLFLQGLRGQLDPFGVHVLTIKPGFVDTPMTVSLKKNFLFVKPDVIASGIYKAILKKKEIVYLPWFWRGIMSLICMIPEKIFKKIKL